MGSQQSRTWLKWLSSSSSILLLIISQVMLGMWLASRRFTFSRLLWSFVVHITIFLLVGYEWQRGMLLISRSCPPVPFFLFPTSSDDGPFSITETRLTPQEMAEQQDRRSLGPRLSQRSPMLALGTSIQSTKQDKNKYLNICLVYAIVYLDLCVAEPIS